MGSLRGWYSSGLRDQQRPIDEGLVKLLAGKVGPVRRTRPNPSRSGLLESRSQCILNINMAMMLNCFLTIRLLSKPTERQNAVVFEHAVPVYSLAQVKTVYSLVPAPFPVFLKRRTLPVSFGVETGRHLSLIFKARHTSRLSFNTESRRG
jgi:hypothetical protein